MLWNVMIGKHVVNAILNLNSNLFYYSKVTKK